MQNDMKLLSNSIICLVHYLHEKKKLERVRKRLRRSSIWNCGEICLFRQMLEPIRMIFKLLRV